VATEQPGAPIPLTGAYALLAPDVGELVREILGRRDPELGERLARQPDVSEQEVDKVQWQLYDEFLEQLGDDWEPSAYGKAVDNALGFFVMNFRIERETDES
jgi:hypothetical protein